MSYDAVVIRYRNRDDYRCHDRRLLRHTERDHVPARTRNSMNSLALMLN
jgi:hypothetical protein